MSARLAIAFLSLGASCGREPGTLEVLAAHRVTDISPEGGWIDLEDEGAWILYVVRKPNSGLWMVNAFRREAGSKDRSDEFSTIAELSDGVLSLDSPLRGSSRLHFCRFGREKLLLPEVGVRFEGDSMPSGNVYRRLDRVQSSTDFAKTVEEPFPAGTWEAVDCPEWGWLEIRQTGVDEENWVRFCRRSGGDVDNDYSLATWRADLMELDSPLFGSTGWSLRRMGEEDWLVPDVLGREGEAASGMHFRLVNRVSRSIGPLDILKGVDLPGEDEVEPLEEF